MKILIIHLSDIHFKTKDNAILKKKGQICQAVQNSTLQADGLFIVISGDIAHSGMEEEYYQAMDFLYSIKDHLKNYSEKEVACIIIPGNHDCNCEIESRKVREMVITNIQQNPDQDITQDMIEQCCEVQSNFFDFSKCYQDEDALLSSNKLVSVYKYVFGEFNIIFDCYNTSWMSQLHEQPGTMHFPLEYYPKEHSEHRADLVISILHHPFNWYNPENSREFQSHIEKTSDIILTGHEHIPSKSAKDDLEGNYTYYREGAVLQKHDGEDSEFNLILIDLEQERYRTPTYGWNGEIYSPTDHAEEWTSYKRRSDLERRKFQINSAFGKRLNELGAYFTHPNKLDLVLEDFFLYPDLRDLKDIVSEDAPSFLNSSSLCKIDGPENKILLIGDQNAGKTSLCKILYKHYYSNDYVPVYIAGDLIKETSIESFDKLVIKCYMEQYSNDTLEAFNQLDKERKVLIIDDLDRSRLNARYRTTLLNRVDNHYPNILVTAKYLPQIDDILSKGKQEELSFQGYQKYQILEFGHLLRAELIKKWNTLGEAESIEEYELFRKIDYAKQIVDMIIGKNFVPPYPLFLLVILQGIEAGFPHDLRQSAYGHYYQALIANALRKLSKRNDVINAYYTYLSELANRLFESKEREISRDKLAEFHEWYCKDKYQVSPSFHELFDFDELIRNLSNALILEENNGTYKFKYKYIYYYSVAKYISDRITEDDMRQRISRMCERLYIEEFANIIIFLIHHSKNPFILKMILTNARRLFQDIEPVRFEEDILNINSLLDEVPKLVLKNRDIRKNREEALRDQDEAELLEKQNQNNDNREEYDLEEGEIKEDIISQVNAASKTINILGQILRSHYGSLEGTTRIDLGQEAYSLGLRWLNSVFSFLEENTDHLVSFIELIIEKNGLARKGNIEDAAKKLLFYFCTNISYSCIKIYIVSDLVKEKVDFETLILTSPPSVC